VKRIVYVDMDNVLVDFTSGIARVPPDVLAGYDARHSADRKDHFDDVPGIFALMDPLPGALESYRELSRLFDTFILSTSPWANPTAWSDKVLWVRKYLDDVAHKRLILAHHKDLLRGDFLIDDSRRNGAGQFGGELLLFGPDGDYKDWPAVMEYLRTKAA
jgi:5'-nucleotidase